MLSMVPNFTFPKRQNQMSGASGPIAVKIANFALRVARCRERIGEENKLSCRCRFLVLPNTLN